MKKILLSVFLIAGLVPAPVFASGFDKDVVIDKTTNNNITNDKSEEINSSTDNWLKNCIQNMNFADFDTSKFSVISSGNSDITKAYTNAAKDMADKGWGQIPTDGAFSSANGFKGYSLTMADGPSNVAQLFKETFSDVYEAMQSGKIMGDLSGFNKSDVVNGNADFNTFRANANQSLTTIGDMASMTNMINSFSSSINNEISGFAGNDLFKSAKNGLSSIDIQKGIDSAK